MRSRLFNTGQANRGARLAGIPARIAGSPEFSCGATPPPAREATSQALVEGASRAAPDRAGGRDGPAAEGSDRFELRLTPNVQATLLLAAKAAGVSPGEFVARAICSYAREAVGFPALSDEFTAVPAFSRVGEPRFRNGGP